MKQLPKELPGVDRLAHLFDYDHKTGILYWKNPTSKRVRPGSEAGSLGKSGYLQVQIDKKIHKLHRVCFKMHNGYCPEVIDHKDRNPLNNRASNLRAANQSENGCNRGIQRNNTSGFKGVSFHKKRNQFLAYAKKNGKTHFAGWHRTADLAAVAAEKMRKTLHGEFVSNG